MTYQFDPRPQGLHFEPFRVAFSPLSMWYLKDGAPEPWIDLRSVFKAMGMSWVKWRMYCMARRAEWKLEACFNVKLGETLLAPGGRMPFILQEVSQLLGSGRHASAAIKVASLRAAWRTKYAQILNTATDADAQPTPGAIRAANGRKVNPYVVRQIYQLLKKGMNKPEIAKALRISEAAVRLISRNKYKLDPESSKAWWETFGADLPS